MCGQRILFSKYNSLLQSIIMLHFILLCFLVSSVFSSEVCVLHERTFSMLRFFLLDLKQKYFVKTIFFCIITMSPALVILRTVTSHIVQKPGNSLRLCSFLLSQYLYFMMLLFSGAASANCTASTACLPNPGSVCGRKRHSLH